MNGWIIIIIIRTTLPLDDGMIKSKFQDPIILDEFLNEGSV